MTMTTSAKALEQARSIRDYRSIMESFPERTLECKNAMLDRLNALAPEPSESFRKALCDSIYTHKVNKDAFEGNNWNTYKDVVYCIRIALSDLYAAKFAGAPIDPTDEQMFFAAYKYILRTASTGTGRDKLMAENIEDEMARYDFLKAKIVTEYLDTPESIKFYDEHILPINMELQSAQVNGMGKAVTDPIRDRLSAAKKDWTPLRKRVKRIGALSDESFRTQFEIALATALENGVIKTARQHDAEKKANKVKKAAKKKAMTEILKA